MGVRVGATLHATEAVNPHAPALANMPVRGVSILVPAPAKIHVAEHVDIHLLTNSTNSSRNNNYGLSINCYCAKDSRNVSYEEELSIKTRFL